MCKFRRCSYKLQLWSTMKCSLLLLGRWWSPSDYYSFAFVSSGFRYVVYTFPGCCTHRLSMTDLSYLGGTGMDVTQMECHLHEFRVMNTTISHLVIIIKILEFVTTNGEKIQWNMGNRARIKSTKWGVVQSCTLNCCPRRREEPGDRGSL